MFGHWFKGWSAAAGSGVSSSNSGNSSPSDATSRPSRVPNFAALPQFQGRRTTTTTAAVTAKQREAEASFDTGAASGMDDSDSANIDTSSSSSTSSGSSSVAATSNTNDSAQAPTTSSDNSTTHSHDTETSVEEDDEEAEQDTGDDIAGSVQRLERANVLTERDEFGRFVMETAKKDVATLLYLRNYLQLQRQDRMLLPHQAARVSELLRCGLLDALAMHLPSIGARGVEWNPTVLHILALITGSMLDAHVQALRRHPVQFVAHIRASLLMDTQETLAEDMGLLQPTTSLLQIMNNIRVAERDETHDLTDVSHHLYMQWLPNFLVDSERNGIEWHGREEALICCLRFLCLEMERDSVPLAEPHSSHENVQPSPPDEAVASVITLLTCCSSNLEVNHWLSAWLDLLVRRHPLEGQASVLKALVGQLAQQRSATTTVTINGEQLESFPNTFLRFRQMLDHPLVWPQTKVHLLRLLAEIVGEDNATYTDWLLHADLLFSVTSILFQGRLAQAESTSISNNNKDDDDHDDIGNDDDCNDEQDITQIRNDVRKHAALVLSNVAAGSDAQRHYLLSWHPERKVIVHAVEEDGGESEDTKSSWIVRRCVRLARNTDVPMSVRVDMCWTLSCLLDVDYEWYSRMLLDKHVPSMVLQTLLNTHDATPDTIELALDILHRLQQSPWPAIRSRMRHWCLANDMRVSNRLEELQIRHGTLLSETGRVLLDHVQASFELWRAQFKQQQQQQQQSPPTQGDAMSSSVATSIVTNAMSTCVVDVSCHRQ